MRLLHLDIVWETLGGDRLNIIKRLVGKVPRRIVPKLNREIVIPLTAVCLRLIFKVDLNQI